MDEVLIQFGKHLLIVRRDYRQFVADGVSKGRRPEVAGGGLLRSKKDSDMKDEPESFDYRVLGVEHLLNHYRRMQPCNQY